MNETTSHQITIEPIINYPRVAEVGKTYLMTVDLRPVVENAKWPYDEEEYTVYCMVDSEPLFHNEPLGESAVVLHRFGGSYGAANFLLNANQKEMIGSIQIHLANEWGLPLESLALDDSTAKRVLDPPQNSKSLI